MPDAAQLLQQAQSLMRLGRRAEALAVALQTEALAPAEPAIHDALGTLLTHLEEPLRALPHFEAAVNHVPASHDYRYNLAMAQRMVGQLAAAEDNLDRVIAARPDDGEAYYARSGLRRQTQPRNHVPELERTLRRLAGRRPGLPVAFALAKEWEDLGEYRRSFAQLHAANRAHRASLRYDVAEDIAVLDKLRTTHTADAIQRIASEFGNDECIFIVGLPRSGTTLVESILGAHPEVFAGGEMDLFPGVLIREVAARETSPVKKLDFVDRVLHLDHATVGKRYLDATRPRTGHTRKFTDKLPMNYLYAGLIHAALPRARFVALRRHPMDSCYAMYKTLFASAYPFSYDLGDLAQYFVAWEALMRHWDTVIGDAWLSVPYETLVASPESVIRGLVAHCGLEWEERCLQFHTRQTGVTTASAAQVRQPLYTDSVGKWRRYADELEPMARHFESHGIAVR